MANIFDHSAHTRLQLEAAIRASETAAALSDEEAKQVLNYARSLHSQLFAKELNRKLVGIAIQRNSAPVWIGGNEPIENYRRIAQEIAREMDSTLLLEGQINAVKAAIIQRPKKRRAAAAVKHASVQLSTVRKFVASSGTRRISGIASSIAVDREGDIVLPAAGKWALPIPLLWQHSHRDPLGKVTKVEVRGGQLWFEAEFAEGVGRIDDVWKLVEQGAIDSLSIGFRGLKWSPTQDGGRRWDSWELLEISVVAVGMNPDAKIRRGAKAHQGGIPLVAAGWRR